jgi:hypothetical protein
MMLVSANSRSTLTTACVLGPMAARRFGSGISQRSRRQYAKHHRYPAHRRRGHSAFDKLQRVSHAAIVENKRLGEILAWIKEQQDRQPRYNRIPDGPRRSSQKPGILKNRALQITEAAKIVPKSPPPGPAPLRYGGLRRAGSRSQRCRRVTFQLCTNSDISTWLQHRHHITSVVEVRADLIRRLGHFRFCDLPNRHRQYTKPKVVWAVR